MIAASPKRYSRVAIALHWLIAILVLGQIAGGLYMHRLPDSNAALKFELYQWHKSFGFSILFLTLFRLGWRLTHKAPALPEGMARWERLLARGAHVCFYVLLVIIPLIGWAVVSSSPFASSVQTYLFGVIHVPHLPFFENVADRKAVSHEFAEVHEYLGFTMLGLIGLHVLAAIKHHFVNRDGVLSSMLPILKVRS